VTDYDSTRYELVTVKDFAAVRKVEPRTVREWIAKGWVNAIRTAGEHGDWRILVPKASKSA
jgi:hypothetical protein